jgi:hypothetical protein
MMVSDEVEVAKVAKDERLTAKQAAELRGVAPKTWWSYVSRGQVPAPDGEAEPCGCPWWWRSTIEANVAAQGSRGPARGTRRMPASS